MELLRNARLSSAESKLESQLGVFTRASSAKKLTSGENRSASTGKIRNEPLLKVNELYTNKEIMNLKRVIKKNPFDKTAQLFMREIRKQEASQNNFQRDENNFMNRSTYRSASKRGISVDEASRIRSESLNNINNVQNQQTINSIDHTTTVKNSKFHYTNQSKINVEQVSDHINNQYKCLNKNMSAQFTNKGSARNFECLKYRIVKYQEHEKVLEQKKQKGSGSIKMLAAKGQQQNLKSQLTSALIQLKEFQDSEDIDKAVSVISKGVTNSDNFVVKQSQRPLTDKAYNQNVESQKEKSLIKQQGDYTPSFFRNESNSTINRQKNISHSANRNNGIDKIKKEMKEESPWMQNGCPRQNMINEVKQLNKQLYEKKLQSQSQQYSTQFKDSIIYNINQANALRDDLIEFKEDVLDQENTKQYQQKIDPDERPIYFDSNTGKRAMGVTENERKLFANFLADKNLNVLLYCRKFDVEPNGHLQKHLTKIKQQNEVNQQIRDKFNQQMLDDTIQSAIKKEQKKQQSSETRTFLSGEFTPSRTTNVSNFQSRIATQNYNSPSNINQENLSSRRSSIERTPKTPGTNILSTQKNNQSQFISVGDFLKQNDKAVVPGQRTQSPSSIMKARKVNSLINQQNSNILEMKQLSLLKQKSSIQNEIISQNSIRVYSPLSKLHIPLNQGDQTKSGDYDKTSLMQIEPSPNIQGLKSISPIKKRGQSAIKFSTYNQIIEGDTYEVQTKSEQAQQNNGNHLFSSFSQAYLIKMQQQEQEEQKDAFIGFIRKGRKAQTQLVSTEPSIPQSGGSQSNTHRQNLIHIKQVKQGSQTTRHNPQTVNSLAYIPEHSSTNQISQQSIGNRSKTIIISHLKKSQELLNTIFPNQQHEDLAKEQDQVLLEKYKYLVTSDKITRVNLKKERRKQKGMSQKLPKKMFDEIGYVYGRNPFSKYKPAKLMKLRLSIVKYLQKVKLLNININEIVEKKIYPLNPFERPGAYIFLSLCRNGSPQQLEEILKTNPYHVNDFNELNQTGLIIAAYYNRLDLCLVLLKYFSDPDIIDSTNKTALYYALKNQNHQLVRYLFYYRTSPWSRYNIKYSEIQMDDEMKTIFDAARVVHFMIQLPYDYNEKVWEVFLKDPIPQMLPDDSEEGSQQESLKEFEEDIPNYSFSNQQNSRQGTKNKKTQSQSSISQHDNFMKYASINSISPLNERQSQSSLTKVKDSSKGKNGDDEQEQYYGDLFKQQNYS